MSACDNPTVLSVILYVKIILKYAFILLPIGAIIMMMIDISKSVIAGKEDEMKKNLNIAIKRVIYLVIIFFVPTIVSFIMNIIDDSLDDDSGYLSCITNATEDGVQAKYQQLAVEKLEEAQANLDYEALDEANTYINKIKDDTVREDAKSQASSIEESINEGIKSTKKISLKTTVKRTTTASASSGGSLDGENSSGGTEAAFYAPIQGGTYTFSSAGTTPGCSNSSVYHDLSIAEGAKVYAGMDGTAYFIQTTSSQVVSGKTVLTSYGNQVKIVGSNGTYIIYAHLSGFANGINTPITETCPKKGSSAPCSATVYASSSSTVDTKTVKKGDLIGYTGNTGNSTGPHLHVEIHTNGSSYCVSDPWSSFGMR